MDAISRWRRAASVYLTRQMAVLFALGFSSGLPRLLVYSTLGFWLLEEGLDIKSVGFFAATATPYSAKILWAPVADRLPLPKLNGWFGQRRSWILMTQVGLLGSILALALTHPGEAPVLAASFAIAIAAFSATQDIVIDAYRVETLDADEQGAGAAVAVLGYRVGMFIASAGALFLVGFMDDLPDLMSALPLTAWQVAYLVMALFMAACLGVTLLAPKAPVGEVEAAASVLRQAVDAVVGPFRDLTQRKGWILLLSFAVFFKLGDGLCGAMTNPLLATLEFTPHEIATVAKTYGLAATLIGVVLGGFLVRGTGIVKALWIAGFMQMFSNIMFVVQAEVGHSTAMLTATIGVENITGGLGTAAFVAYLSSLCSKNYTATQYALLTALAAFSRTILSTGSGWAVEQVGWAPYFVLTTVAAIPGLLLLYVLVRMKATDFDDSPVWSR